MNIKRIIKPAAVMLVSVILATLLSACGREDFNMFFGIDEMPQNIDPQKASSYSELLTVRNCFKGLTRLLENSDAVLDLADEYSVSDDRLTFTFTLRDGAKWSDGSALEADDFVFAYERAKDPETKAPQADLLINIESVFAADRTTVVYKLKTADENFLARIANPVFMPCNRSFFEKCGGKYGLSQKHILTNGNFRVKSWSEGSFIRLIRVAENKSRNSMANSVYLSVSSKGKDNVSRAVSKEVGMTVDFGSDIFSSDVSSLEISSEYRTAYAIVFNKNSAVGSNKKITDAFAMCVHREYYLSRCNQAVKNAGSVFPDDGTVCGKDISELMSAAGYAFNYEPETARNLFLKGISELEKKTFPNVEIVAVDEPSSKSVLGDVVSKWQSELGAYVNIKTVKDKKALTDTLRSGSYTVAFVPLPSDAVETVKLFSDGGYLDIGNGGLNGIVGRINDTDSIYDTAHKIGEAAAVLSETSLVIPIISTPTTALWDKRYTNVSVFKTDMTVDFSVICKS